ncbi:hypothetical protein [Gracilimonas sp.]|uniref:hypothetical protein n=1 Tax=Gracilimonas sp. TaxID=1974203 RepID=UPI003D1412B7
MDIDSKKIQKLEGYFEIDGKPQENKKLFEVEASIDRFNLRDSYIKFFSPVPKPKGGDTIRFVINSKNSLDLKFPSSYWGGDYSEVSFSIDKVTLQESKEKYVRTGSFKRLIYFPEEIEVFGYTVRKCEHQYHEGEKRIKENYFEWNYQNSITKREIDKVLMALSFLTCCSLFISEHSNGSTITIFDKRSDKFTLPYMGSGMMFFPLSINTIEKLIKNVKWEYIYNFHLAYKNFCRAKNYEYQLYKGCSILDYLISLFERNLDIKELRSRLKNSDKSSKLYALLFYLELDNSTKLYLEKIFPGVSFSEFHLDKKFEFYELRDGHLHRGQLFLTQNEVWKFQRCLVSVNEIIRILIPHLDKIKEWDFTGKPFYKTASSKEIVNARQDLIKWKP